MRPGSGGSRSAVLAALVDVRLQHGDLTGAGVSARDMVDADPLNEGGHRRLMLAYARVGQRCRALRQSLSADVPSSDSPASSPPPRPCASISGSSPANRSDRRDYVIAEGST